MPHRNKPEIASARRPRITIHLIIAFNTALVSVLGAFAFWDYRATYSAELDEKRIDLQDEATTILPAIGKWGRQDISATQELIDEVCGAMQETTSPGHHIAVQIGSVVLQAHAHQRASADLFSTMQRAVTRPDGIASVSDGTEIIAGSASNGDVAVYVSEYVSNFSNDLWEAILRRVLAILIVGVALGIVLNLILRRRLARPLNGMVQVVSRFRGGDHSARMPSRTTMEMGMLADEFDHMAADLQHAELVRNLEMNRARAIQEHLLPDLTSYPGLVIKAVFNPASAVAGDYYDVLALPDNCILACLADVAGHGVSAAMGAAMLKTSLKMIMETESRPNYILARLNTVFYDIMPPSDFASMFILCIEPNRHIAHFANAGHPPAYLMRKDGQVEALEPTGALLGVMSDEKWQLRQLTLDAEDRILLYSDGLIELRSETGELFGEERLKSILASTRQLDILAQCDAVQKALSNYRGAAEQADDITMLNIEMK